MELIQNHSYRCIEPISKALKCFIYEIGLVTIVIEKNFKKFFIENKLFIANDIPYSQAVTLPSTNGTRRNLTSGS